jgi:hypothetical protein
MKTEYLCDSCQLRKLSRLSFSSSEHSSTDFFKKFIVICGDLPSILSIGKFRYYACFVDDFCKYTWIIPLKFKSEFTNAFLAFEQYAIIQFNKQIKVFHSDGGGEFVNSKLSSHFLFTGVIHQVSYLYTPKQKGTVEQCHCVIKELGVTMLFNSWAPLFLWVEAFTTVIYIIKRLPSSSINFETLSFKLYYTHLIILQ